GWQVDNGPGRLASFYPAERFRKALYRPDVVKLVLDKGDVGQALAAANAALPKEQRPASDAVADVGHLLPPKGTLRLVSREANGTVRLATELEAGANAPAVRSLRLMVDGRPLPGEDFVKTFRDGPPPTTVSWPALELPPGQHRIVILTRTVDASV